MGLLVPGVALSDVGPAVVDAAMKPEPLRWWEWMLMAVLVAITVTLLLNLMPWRGR